MFVIEATDRNGLAIIWNRKRGWWYEKDSYGWSYSLSTECGYSSKRGASVAMAKIWPGKFNKKVIQYSSRQDWIDGLEGVEG